MNIVFTWDDGAKDDLRLMELHEKYSIPATFFVPTRNSEGRSVLTPSDIRTAESEIISFGGHTYNHVYLTSIPIEKVGGEVYKNKEYLENILGHAVIDFCLPGGKYNDVILKEVYKYYETIRTADTMCFSYNGGLIKPSIHFYPRGFKSLVGNAGRNFSINELIYLIKNLKCSYFEFIKLLVEFESEKDNKSVIIWGHSWEISELHLWNELESLFSFIHNEYLNECIKYRDLFTEKTK